MKQDVTDSEIELKPTLQRSNPTRSWDLFCAVVDNFGDIGVCWRLAQQLACEHGIAVRLWVDKLESFACLCPSISTEASVQHMGPIEIRRWAPNVPFPEIADVVIEAFACELPANYIEEMARRTVAPVWINLEYLSAEPWIEDCHLLPSVQSRSPLKKYFFFPGFTAKTGGLLRERPLLVDRARFDSAAATEFLRSLNILGIDPGSRSSNLIEFGKCESGKASRNNNELWVSLFCYDNPALPELLECWAEGSLTVRVLAAPGQATDQIGNWFEKPFTPGDQLQRGSLTVNALPFLLQSDYDRLLWSCDVNFVRGEDSFVRAQWAQKPFVWQIYPQAENAHLVKLDAFLDRYVRGFPSADTIRKCWHAWNGVGEMGAVWRDFVENRYPIERHGKVWASELDRAGNLADNLVRFVCEK